MARLLPLLVDSSRHSSASRAPRQSAISDASVGVRPSGSDTIAPSPSMGRQYGVRPGGSDTHYEVRMILSEEQLAIQESARKFALARLAPHSAEWEQKAAFPPGIFQELGALGFMGMTVPTEWGGAGADHVAYSLALQEIAAGDGALATVVSGHNSVGVMPILNYGTEAQKRRYVRDLASGAKLTAFALTEPQGGSDAASIRTRAVRKGDSYVLSGTKQFITSG